MIKQGLRWIKPRNTSYSTNTSEGSLLLAIIMILIAVIIIAYIVYHKYLKGFFGIRRVIKKNQVEKGLKYIKKERKKKDSNKNSNKNLLNYYEALIYLNREDRKFNKNHFEKLDIDISGLSSEERCNMLLAQIEIIALEKKDQGRELDEEDMETIQGLLVRFSRLAPSLERFYPIRLLYEEGKMDFLFKMNKRMNMNSFQLIIRDELYRMKKEVGLLARISSEFDSSLLDNLIQKSEILIMNGAVNKSDHDFTFPIYHVERKDNFRIVYRIILITLTIGIVNLILWFPHRNDVKTADEAVTYVQQEKVYETEGIDLDVFVEELERVSDKKIDPIAVGDLKGITIYDFASFAFINIDDDNKIKSIVLPVEDITSEEAHKLANQLMIAYTKNIGITDFSAITNEMNYEGYRDFDGIFMKSYNSPYGVDINFTYYDIKKYPSKKYTSIEIYRQ